MTVPLDHPLAGLWSANAWRPGLQSSPNHDTPATRKLELARRLDVLLSKQRPRIKAPDAEGPVRPTRESIVAALSHDPAPDARTQYPRTRRAANYANPDFDVRRGTTALRQPSYGVGQAFRYGRGAGGEENVGTPTPGSLLTVSGRYRIGGRPAHSPGARRVPPYGTKDGVSVDRSGPRTTPLDGHQYIEQQSQTSQNAYRKPRLVGVRTQPRSKRPSRRQGYMPLDPTRKQAAANIQGALHVARNLGDYERRKRKKKARLMAKKVELVCLHDLLKGEQVRKALAQADDALQCADNSRKVLKGFHPDSKVFTIWERAIQLLKREEQSQQVTMKALK
jgi:hypothetical protein